MNIGFLASGNLGYKVIKSLAAHLQPQFIATDSASSDMIQFAESNGIPLFKGNPRKGRLCEFLRRITTDILFSVNYLFLVERDVLDLTKYPVNLHGSLLPKYRGRTPHVWAIINNEKHTGVTAHLMDEGCDTGDIILQREVEIKQDMTGADVLAEFEILYPEVVMEVMSLITAGTVRLTPQCNMRATYFGKRRESDGCINWDWQRERIQNWVRAQAYPYPGAFTFIANEKVIIDKIRFSDFGFDQEMANGMVLGVMNGKVVVKTPNGAVELATVRNPECLAKLTKGKILA